MNEIYVGSALQVLFTIAAVGAFYWGFLAFFGSGNEHKR